LGEYLNLHINEFLCLAIGELPSASGGPIVAQPEKFEKTFEGLKHEYDKLNGTPLPNGNN